MPRGRFSQRNQRLWRASYVEVPEVVAAVLVVPAARVVCSAAVSVDAFASLHAGGPRRRAYCL